MHEKEKFKALSEELQHTINEVSEYWALDRAHKTKQTEKLKFIFHFHSKIINSFLINNVKTFSHFLFIYFFEIWNFVFSKYFIRKLTA
jgi:hypothetical protein